MSGALPLRNRSCDSGMRSSAVQPSLVDRDGGLPDRVPRVVAVGVVGDDGVALRAGGADLECRARQPVVERIDIEREPVGVGILVPPRHARDDPGGLAVVQPHADVERGVVVENAHLGALGGRLAFVRLVLAERRRPRLPPARTASSSRPSISGGASARRARSEAGASPGEGPARARSRIPTTRRAQRTTRA